MYKQVPRHSQAGSQTVSRPQVHETAQQTRLPGASHASGPPVVAPVAVTHAGSQASPPAAQQAPVLAQAWPPATQGDSAGQRIPHPASVSEAVPVARRSTGSQAAARPMVLHKRHSQAQTDAAAAAEAATQVMPARDTAAQADLIGSIADMQHEQVGQGSIPSPCMLLGSGYLALHGHL